MNLLEQIEELKNEKNPYMEKINNECHQLWESLNKIPDENWIVEAHRETNEMRGVVMTVTLHSHKFDEDIVQAKKFENDRKVKIAELTAELNKSESNKNKERYSKLAWEFVEALDKAQTIYIDGTIFNWVNSRTCKEKNLKDKKVKFIAPYCSSAYKPYPDEFIVEYKGRRYRTYFDNVDCIKTFGEKKRWY